MKIDKQRIGTMVHSDGTVAVFRTVSFSSMEEMMEEWEKIVGSKPIAHIDRLSYDETKYIPYAELENFLSKETKETLDFLEEHFPEEEE
jgi:hypothetical protein|tara:strand:+ start:780 stop:1046 length:267 start_codon:yes stop_codon:yes gene_type:complete